MSWLGKSSSWRVNYCLACMSVSASTTALFWVELDLCICFIHQHTLLHRLGARKRDHSCGDADSDRPVGRAEQRDANTGRLCSARVLVDSTVAVALQMWHISLLACSEPAVGRLLRQAPAPWVSRATEAAVPSGSAFPHLWRCSVPSSAVQEEQKNG